MSIQRVPIPSQGDGVWGEVLNGFFGVSHEGTERCKMLIMNWPTGLAPTNAARAQVIIGIQSCLVGEIHYIDDISVTAS